MALVKEGRRGGETEALSHGGGHESASMMDVNNGAARARLEGGRWLQEHQG